ncbi:MAG: hypothetical protein K2W82_17585 [Candidatus Obscuribacterales bacterium]|nr:hypothetical protein [Candidatus Obscuribacterales bacterium]
MSQTKLFAGKKVLLIAKDTRLAGILKTDAHPVKKLVEQGAAIAANIKPAHEQHHRSLTLLENLLTGMNVPFKLIGMDGEPVDIQEYGLVISVGGDGTFLYAAQLFGDHLPLLGYNSAYPISIGHFCLAHEANIGDILVKVFAGDLHTIQLTRLDLIMDGVKLPARALNEVFVGHASAGGTSRYILTIGDVTERQRGGGVIIGTPSGSTGWLDSAGGFTQPIAANCFQYRVRDLIVGFTQDRVREKFTLYKNILPASAEVKIVSGMDSGVLFIDGEHVRYDFPYGCQLTVRVSDKPLHAFIDVCAHDIYFNHPYTDGLPAELGQRRERTWVQAFAGFFSKLRPL